MKKKIKIALTIGWLILIFIFSNQSGYKSKMITDNVINFGLSIEEKITGHERSPKEKRNITAHYFVIVRKTAHFSEYLILTFVFISLLKEFGMKEKKRIILSLVIVLLAAIFDEFHQFFVINRSAQIKDVLIDTSGAIVAVIIYLFYLKIVKRK